MGSAIGWRCVDCHNMNPADAGQCQTCNQARTWGETIYGSAAERDTMVSSAIPGAIPGAIPKPGERTNHVLTLVLLALLAAFVFVPVLAGTWINAFDSPTPAPAAQSTQPPLVRHVMTPEEQATVSRFSYSERVQIWHEYDECEDRATRETQYLPPDQQARAFSDLNARYQDEVTRRWGITPAEAGALLSERTAENR